jgi:DNA-binding NtrC family response regulator
LSKRGIACDPQWMNAKSKATRRSAHNVVIVCAEEEVRDVVAHWLTLHGMEVVVADDGYQAARALRRGSSWLITDRVLPPWPGLDPFLDLRSRYPDLNIVFVEGTNVHDTILARVTGANATLSRPLTRQAVIGALSFADAAE